MITEFLAGMKVASWVLGFVGALILIPGVLILLFGVFGSVLQWVVKK